MFQRKRYKKLSLDRDLECLDCLACAKFRPDDPVGNIPISYGAISKPTKFAAQIHDEFLCLCVLTHPYCMGRHQRFLFPSIFIPGLNNRFLTVLSTSNPLKFEFLQSLMIIHSNLFRISYACTSSSHHQDSE